MKNRMKERALIIAAILASLFWVPRGVIIFCIDAPCSNSTDSINACNNIYNLVTRYFQPHMHDSNSIFRDFTLSKAEKAWQSCELPLPDRMAYAMLTIRIPSASDRDNRAVQTAYNRRLLTWLKRGAKLDPGNALYNLRMAYIYFDNACEYTGTRKMTGLRDPVRRHRTRDRYYQMPFEISDRASLNEGISQYHQALSKPLRTYQHESLRLLFSRHARPWITEQYSLIPAEYISVIGTPQLGKPIYLYMVAKRLAKEGDTRTASELLDMEAYFKLHANHVGLGGRLAELLDRSATLWEIAIDQGQPAKAQNYLRINQRLFSTRQSATYYLDPWGNIPFLSLTAQLIGAGVLGVLTLLVIVSLVRQLFWSIQTKASHNTPLSISHNDMPNRIAAICIATVAILILVVTIVQLIFGDGSYTLQGWLSVVQGILGFGSFFGCWFVFRHQFKRQCEREGIPVPKQWVELSSNLATLAAIGLVWFMFYQSALVDHSYDTLVTIGILPIIAVVVFCIWCKRSTPDYYALANRVTRRFMIKLGVLIALIVMPLLLLQEVLMLQVGKTGLAAYKSIDSVIKYDQAYNREDVQQLHRLLTDADR